MSRGTLGRGNGLTHWPHECRLTAVASPGGSFARWPEWAFVSEQAVLHEGVPRHAEAVTRAVLGNRRPDLRVSERATAAQDCLADVLRDLRYAADCGATVVAPLLTRMLQSAIPVGCRR